MAAGDATPFPAKNAAYRITFPILDADGDLVTGATGLDSEVSKDGGTFADCTNEATEIATSSGVYYLDLTASEMNADTVAVIVKTTSSGAKTTTLVIYPTKGSDLNVVVGGYSSGQTPLQPTVAGRTLDVSVGGEAGIDWANVGSPTTTLNLSGTTISTSQQVASVTGNVGGNVVGSVGSVVGTVTANTTQLAGQTVTAAAGVTFPATVSSLTAAGVRTELTTELGRIDAAVSSRSTLTAANVWQTDVSGYTTAGYAGTYLKGAGSSGDPWNTPLPGSYGTGTAGKIIGDNINATISSRLATSGYTAPLDAAGTRSALGLASANLDTQLDALPTAVENAAAVWNALVASYTVNGSFGERVLRGKTTQVEVQVNGNGHVASVLHSSEADSITVGAFAANSITAAALASDAATEIATATLTTAMTESYRAAGVAPTLAQAAFELIAHMGDMAISGQTKTLKKIDGSTAKTFTLDSSTAPTSITEST